MWLLSQVLLCPVAAEAGLETPRTTTDPISERTATTACPDFDDDVDLMATLGGAQIMEPGPRCHESNLRSNLAHDERFDHPAEQITIG
jgi:hypothetical protein